jgi:hypothetical protein
MKFEFYLQIFEKFYKVKVNGNPSLESERKDGRADGNDEASSLLSQLCESVRNYLSCRDCNDTRAYIVPVWVTL